MTTSALFDLLRDQHGAVSHAQLEALDVSAKRRRHKVDTGEWTQAAPGVIVANSTPRSWEQQATIALLCGGGPLVLSHSAAARVHRFDGFDRNESVHVLASRHQSPCTPPWVTVHFSRRLEPADVTVVEGLGVTTVATTLVHIAGIDTSRNASNRRHAASNRAGQALDGVLRSGVSPQWIRETAERWKGHGVSGPPALLALLDDRVGKRLPRSWFQRLANEVLRGSGIRLQDEYPVHDPTTGRLLAELDLAHPELRVGVECQSWQWHGSPSAQRRDTTRRRRLRALGWEIADVWWNDLHRRAEVVADLVTLIERQRKMRTGS
ncbi:unannotated protein [freshwater metagenome]|uniref:Unannotated protein n=1 Tax=freshwater metagenome TaxID=449393 RepID=A0A6J7CWY4_9ZZZZ|nr:hypothetical protein [Actinomycetota bacterium]